MTQSVHTLSIADGLAWSWVSMKTVAPHDRPREKLERLGPAGLGDNELLALVLGSGSRGRNALDLANDLIDRAGGMHGLTRVTVGDLRRVAGVGRARAAQVLAAIELGRRTLARGGVERPNLRSPRNWRLTCCRSMERGGRAVWDRDARQQEPPASDPNRCDRNGRLRGGASARGVS